MILITQQDAESDAVAEQIVENFEAAAKVGEIFLALDNAEEWQVLLAKDTIRRAQLARAQLRIERSLMAQQ